VNRWNSQVPAELDSDLSSPSRWCSKVVVAVPARRPAARPARVHRNGSTTAPPLPASHRSCRLGSSLHHCRLPGASRRSAGVHGLGGPAAGTPAVRPAGSLRAPMETPIARTGPHGGRGADRGQARRAAVLLRWARRPARLDGVPDGTTTCTTPPGRTGTGRCRRSPAPRVPPVPPRRPPSAPARWPRLGYTVQNDRRQPWGRRSGPVQDPAATGRGSGASRGRELTGTAVYPPTNYPADRTWFLIRASMAAMPAQPQWADPLAQPEAR